MNFLKKIILVLIFLFPISNSFSSMTYNQQAEVHDYDTSGSSGLIALGYIPHQDTEYAFSLKGSENLLSKFEIKKNINGYDLSFNLNDDLTNLGNNKEASINLNKVF